uniref:Activin_recp domain-containing protein n=1 Tax=Caenorhabditis tropicalis TaxID=1561998 RepID=A0A1I7TMC0_9PELO
MHLSDFLLILAAVILLSTVSQVSTLRCKCTKESETVTCTDGVCDTENGSCLMLDHPTMGIHYTCHNKGLKDGSCHNRTSKSGVSVKICGCTAPDFCNFSMWPDKSGHHHHKHHHKQHHEEAQGEETINSVSPISTFFSIIFSSFLYFIL